MEFSKLVAAGNRYVAVDGRGETRDWSLVAVLNEPVDHFPLEAVGPQVQNHASFPNRLNFEIVNGIDRRRIRARIFGRGEDETFLLQFPSISDIQLEMSGTPAISMMLLPCSGMATPGARLLIR